MVERGHSLCRLMDMGSLFYFFLTLSLSLVSLLSSLLCKISPPFPHQTDVETDGCGPEIALDIAVL